MVDSYNSKLNNDELNRYARGYVLVNYDLCTHFNNHREIALCYRFSHRFDEDVCVA